MGIKGTLVLEELARMALQVFLGCQDFKVGRVIQEMSSLQGQVLPAHLAALGLVDLVDSGEFLEIQGLKVRFFHIRVNKNKPLSSHGNLKH